MKMLTYLKKDKIKKIHHGIMHKNIKKASLILTKYF